MTAQVPESPRLQLHIGALQTVVSTICTAQHAAPIDSMVLDIGFVQIAGLHFKCDIPTPLELEYAIQTVEDQVVRARTLVPPGSWLAVSDVELHAIVFAAHGNTTLPNLLTLEEVEHTFNRMAAVSLGRPANSESMPLNKSFAAALLILREFMHHLQCPGVHVS